MLPAYASAGFRAAMTRVLQALCAAALVPSQRRRWLLAESQGSCLQTLHCACPRPWLPSHGPPSPETPSIGYGGKTIPPFFKLTVLILSHAWNGPTLSPERGACSVGRAPRGHRCRALRAEQIPPGLEQLLDISKATSCDQSPECLQCLPARVSRGNGSPAPSPGRATASHAVRGPGHSWVRKTPARGESESHSTPAGWTRPEANVLGRAAVPRSVCPRGEEGAHLPSGALVVQLDGHGFHFCVFGQSVFA